MLVKTFVLCALCSICMFTCFFVCMYAVIFVCTYACMFVGLCAFVGCLCSDYGAVGPICRSWTPTYMYMYVV